MTDKKNWGSTVLGWFVVKDEAAPGAPSPSDDAAAIAAAASEPPPVAFVKDIPAAPGGKVDFGAVYEAAGIDSEEQQRVVKAADLLSALPAETPPAVKKQIVEASLKAFGVPIDKIIEGAVQEIQALESYIRAGAGDTQKVLEESQKRIADFEDEIKRTKAVREDRVAEQQAVVKACNDKKLEVQHVLEFFGQETVARVVRESPKLVEPAPPAR
jgi:hypothetical protein